MSLLGPYVLASVLAGVGITGVLVRRNAVLLLVGVELLVAAALVLLVSTGVDGSARWAASGVLALFVVTLAAAEVVLALAVVLAAFRHGGSIDLDEPSPRARASQRGRRSRPAGDDPDLPAAADVTPGADVPTLADVPGPTPPSGATTS